MIKKAFLNDIIASRSHSPLSEATVVNRDGITFADVTAFHVYCDLTLNLALAAAEQPRNADKYLEILDEYARLAEECGFLVGAVLLEVQGERLHFLLPAEKADAASVFSLLRFAIALTQSVYARIKLLAGDHWNGFAMAADHGRAIIVATGTSGDDSVVSLGNAANTPAKRLARTPAVKAGHLVIPTLIAAESRLLLGGAAHSREERWLEIDVNEPGIYLQPAVDAPLLQEIKEAADSIANDAPMLRRSVNFASADKFANTTRATIDDPIEVQGLCLRADLDGFSQQVHQAFAAGTEQAIRDLVERFALIMELPQHFAARMNRPIISLPWAGDCATQLVLLKPGETYQTIRRFLPPTSSMTWQSANGRDDQRLQQIREAVQGARWSVGVAGGDADEGSAGTMLVANLRTSRRTFLVAAGWNVRRSLDAQQAKNVKAGDTVLHTTDCDALSPEYKAAFCAIPEIAIFRRAPFAALAAAKAAQITAAGQQRPIVMPHIRAAVIPASKPYGRK